MKQLWIALFAITCIFTACKRKDYSIKANDAYEKGKLSIEEIEKKEPARFLTVTGNSKRNLLGQTVIRGTIFNNAKMVHFKDIELKLTFYSKTRALLEQDREVIYETINPGGSTSFKSKYFAPKGTDSVGIKVISAKF